MTWLLGEGDVNQSLTHSKRKNASAVSEFWTIFFTLTAALVAGAVLAGGGSSAIELTGGTSIGIQAAPRAVLVNYGTSDTNYGCTGTIVSASLVVTSAHCMYESDSR